MICRAGGGGSRLIDGRWMSAAASAATAIVEEDWDAFGGVWGVGVAASSFRIAVVGMSG